MGNSPIMGVDPDGGYTESPDWYQGRDSKAVIHNSSNDATINIGNEVYDNIGKYVSINKGFGFEHYFQDRFMGLTKNSHNYLADSRNFNAYLQSKWVSGADQAFLVEWKTRKSINDAGEFLGKNTIRASAILFPAMRIVQYPSLILASTSETAIQYYAAEFIAVTIPSLVTATGLIDSDHSTLPGIIVGGYYPKLGAVIDLTLGAASNVHGGITKGSAWGAGSSAGSSLNIIY
jgi:hypothetical protein